MNENQKRLQKQVVAAAEFSLLGKGYASAIEVFARTGRLEAKHLESWRKGRLRYLEAAIHGNLSTISRIMAFFRRWARDRNLNPSETAYVRHTPGPRRDLRFSKSGNPTIERLYRTHYVSPVLREKRQQKSHKKPDLQGLGDSGVTIRNRQAEDGRLKTDD